MATEGGGKIKSKRQTLDSRPYSRRQSLLGRMTNTVKDMLSPSWVIDLVNGVRKSPPKQLQHDVDSQEQEPDGEIPVRRELNRMSADDTAMMNTTNLQSHTGAPPTIGQPNPMSYSHASPQLPYNSYRPQAPIPQHIMTNGDDQSVDNGEFSGATSGCSSFIPPPDRKEYQGDIIQMNESHLRQLQHHMELRTMPSSHNTSTDAANSSTSSAMEGSFLWSSSKPRISKPQPPAQSRTPSFNSSLLSPLKGDRSTFHQSPYYPGKTGFGGAASYRKARIKQSNSPYEPSPTRKQVQAKPLNNSSLGGVTSSTAKRILDTLERMSTPLSDAKKIPLDGNISDSVLSMTPGTYRRRRNPNTSLSHSINEGPPTTQRALSSFASIATNVHKPPAPKPKAQENSKGEESEKSQYQPGISEKGGGRAGKMKRERGSHYSTKQVEEEEVEAPNLPTNFVLPVSNFTMPPLGIAVNTQPSSTDTIQTESVSLARPPIKSTSPDFSFASPIVKSSSGDSEESAVSTEFQFSSPIAVDENTSKPASSPPSGFAFKSSSTAPKMKSPAVNFKSPEEINSNGCLKPASELKTGSVMDILGKKTSSEPKPGSVTEVIAKHTPTPNGSIGGIQPASGLKSGSVMDILGKSSKLQTPVSSTAGAGLSALASKPAGAWTCDTCLVPNKATDSKCVACQTPKPTAKQATTTSSSTASSGSSLQSLFKQPSGGWTCTTCLIQNKADSSKCVACETAKPIAKPAATSSSAETSKSSGSGFSLTLSKSNGDWTCDTCLIKNKADVLKCAACETPKPGSKQVPAKPAETNTSTVIKPFQFGNPTKKAANWECDTCLVNNKPEANKCVACEMPKPGSKPPTGFTSTGGFSFGVGSGFGSSSSETSTTAPTMGFKFGASAAATSAPSTSTSATASTGGFSFGKASEKKEESKSDPPTGGFKFGGTSISSLNTKDDTSKPSFGGFKFGQAKSAGSDDKKESEKQTFGGFKFGGSTSAQAEKKTAEVTKPSGGLSFGQNTVKEKTETKDSSAVSNTNFHSGETAQKETVGEKLAAPAAASPFQFGVPVSKDANANENKPLGTGSSGGFSFGMSNQTAKNDAPTPTFQFNAKPTASSTNLTSVSKPNDIPKPVFGVSNALEKPAASSGGFSFGNSTAQPPASGGFAFGANKKGSTENDKPTASVPVFTFGAATNKESTSTTGSTFTMNAVNKPGELAAQQSAPTFNFNKEAGSTVTSATSPGKRGRDDMESGSDAKKANTSFASQSISSGFKFGDAAPATTTSGFTFGQPSTTGFGANTSSNSTTGGFTGFGTGSQNTGGNVFGAPTPQTGSVFGSSTTSAAPTFGSSAPAPAFGASTTTPAPSGGMNLTTPPTFNFGGAGSSAPASGLFQFSAGTNQANTAASAGSGSTNFVFGQGGAPTQPTAPAAAPAPTFNATPSFNFTGSAGTGQAPAVFGFNAQGGAAAGNSNPFDATGAGNANNPRRFKKAVRKLRK